RCSTTRRREDADLGAGRALLPDRRLARGAAKRTRSLREGAAERHVAPHPPLVRVPKDDEPGSLQGDPPLPVARHGGAILACPGDEGASRALLGSLGRSRNPAESRDRRNGRTSRLDGTITSAILRCIAPPRP